MPEITEDTLKEIEAEYSKWGEYLNGGIGLLSFSFGLSCLGTPRPDLTGFLSLAFVLILALYGKERFPKKLKELRKKELYGIDELALLGFEKKYFGFMALVKNFPVYLIGWSFLGLVTLYGIAIESGWL
jgi:hypothetical protein